MLRKKITILISSNEEMKDIMKIVKELEDSGLIMKGATMQEKKECGILRMLLGTLSASLLENMLAGKGKEKQKLVKEQLG